MECELEVRLAPSPELTRRLKPFADGVCNAAVDGCLATLWARVDHLLYQFWDYV
jgi:hypothetical protein